MQEAVETVSEVVSANVLGGLLMDNSQSMSLDLVADDFLNQSHRQVYSAVMELISDNQPADIITVSERLNKQTGRDWFGLLNEITRDTYSTANLSHYAKLLKDDSRKRKALDICNRLQLELNSGSDGVDEAIRDLISLNVGKKNHECGINAALKSAIENIEVAFDSDGSVTGITTGLVDLDKCLSGLHSPDLIVLGARPSVGKTALLINMVLASDSSCGVISSEQGRDQLGMRSLAIDGSVSAHGMRLGNLKETDFSRITASSVKLKDKVIRINDHPSPTIDDVIRQARSWKFTHDIKLLFVDYIQRIKVNSQAPKHERIEIIVMALKSLAKELNIAVVALAQVNRQVESRENKRPLMSDLKDSGSIEQEADVIMTLYRDEVYNPETPDKGIAEITVLKNRHGPTGFVRCVWNGEFMQFHDMEKYRESSY